METMEGSEDASLWYWAGLELLTTREPTWGTTLLHVAASANNASAVRELTSIWMNPLLRDGDGKLAIDLTTDAGIRAELLQYAAQPCRREVMRWYGPIVLREVWTFLLVVQRWKNDGLCWAPNKDIVRIVINELRMSSKISLSPDCSEWSHVRLSGDQDIVVESCFARMAQCEDPSTWRWVGLEMLTTRHPKNDSTLLHVAARTNNAVAVRELMCIWMNPLLRDKDGKVAADVATDAGIRAELRRYTVQSPRREVMRWFGPFLMQRSRAFLLIVLRWRKTKVRVLPRSVVLAVIGHLMSMEYA